MSSVLPIFIITLIGKLTKTYWLKADEFWKSLEKLSYFLLFPVVLFNYISAADLGSMHHLKLVFGLIAATSIVSVLLGYVQKSYEIDGRIYTSIFQGAIRYNSYIFFALGSSLFGKDGMIIVAVIAAYMIIFTNFISVLVFSLYSPVNEEISERIGISQWSLLIQNLATNPLIIASFIGFLFNNFDIRLSSSIVNTLQIISNSALAVGILCVGASLKINLLHLNRTAIAIACIAKLLVLPTITFFVLKIIGITGVAHSVGMLYSSLPTASNSYFLSKQLGGDPESMSAIITFSIIVSVLSISTLMYILG